MRTTSRIRRVWLALWLTLCGACSPTVDPLPDSCTEAPTIHSVASSSTYPTLVVNQGLDATGRPYQSFRITVTSPVETHTTEDVNAPYPPYSFSLYINNRRQRVFVWNNTAVGPWRIEQVGAASTCRGFDYDITVGTTSNGPCEERVCRGLQDTDVVQVRVDVCSWMTGECTTGATLLTQVAILPL